MVAWEDNFQKLESGFTHGGPSPGWKMDENGLVAERLEVLTIICLLLLASCYY